MALTAPWKFLLPALACLALIAGPSRAAPQPVPDELKTEGLVIFELARHPAQQRGGPNIWMTHAEISGNRYRDVLRHNVFAVALPPGEYTLDKLYGDSAARDSTNVGSLTVYTTPTAEWMVNRKFTIEAGKVTNLGAFLFMEDSADPARFRLFYIDNSKMPSGLNRVNPKLAATLTPDKFTLAPGPYISHAQLNGLRMELLAAKLRKMTPAAIEQSNFVTSSAGSLALLAREGAKPPSMKLLDPGSFQLARCQNWRTGVACDLRDNRLLLIDVGSRKEVRYAQDFNPTDFVVFGDRGIVLVDAGFRILISTDAGESWKLDESRKLDKETLALRPGLQTGANGFYVYSRVIFGKPEIKRLLYAPYGKMEMQPIDLPEEVEKISLLLETDRGLYVSPGTVKNTGPLYFRANGKAEWEKMAPIPGWGCSRLIAAKNDSNRLTAICGTRTEQEAAEYLSEDGGASWRKGVQVAP